MHELSIVCSIIDMAEKVAREHQARQVDEIELEIGQLSGVEWAAFDLAWQTARRHTALENSGCTVSRPAGKAECLDCGIRYDMQALYDNCPVCGSYFKNILQGQELRVKAVVVS